MKTLCFPGLKDPQSETTTDGSIKVEKLESAENRESASTEAKTPASVASSASAPSVAPGNVPAPPPAKRSRYVPNPQDVEDPDR